MSRSIFSVLSICAFCCAPALAQSSSSGMSDQQFVDFAAQTDMTEAHLGQVAQDQAAGQNIKEYGQMLVTDHTTDYNQLTAAAGKANLTVPKGLDAAHDKMIALIAKMKGTAFDTHYVHEMVIGHEKAIAQYKEEAQNGQNAEIKAYANQALPVLEKHLEAAKNLMKSKGKPKT
jgi:putative membrane protein